MRNWAKRVMLAGLMLGSTNLWGCTLCSSDTGHVLRQGIMKAGFASTCLKTLAPAPFLVLGALWAARILGKSDNNHDGQ
jgi:hypothetical protein